MKKLRVGIIGAGMAFEQLHYPAYQELSDKFEIVAICDLNPQKANYWVKKLNLAQQKDYSAYRSMVVRDDLDVIDIMVPIELNYKITEDVASLVSGSRKWIICEKPLAATPEETKSAMELPEKYHVPIMITENYRYNEETNIIRDYINGGRIGEVLYFMQNRVVNFLEDMNMNKFPSTEWRQHPEFPGGAILDTGVHDIAALRHIFGAIDKVQGFGVPQGYDFSPYAVICVNMLFKSGLIGQFSFFCSGKEMQRPWIGLRIFGTKGMIYLEERDCGTINIAYNDGHLEQIPYRKQRGYYNELLNLYQAAAGNEPISVTPELEFGDTNTIFQILEAVREGETMPVDREIDFIPAYDLERKTQAVYDRYH
ncbi:Gfo/Idh/MocA family oxidoreductase [Pelotomaculum terephthalicicum JT]|uniref:Gfo/Idh/MocA family protein n=1 Tax=Pelotomaculum TaxID=191373 RepID=UPI0009CD6ADE|nr:MULTISPECIES: Gfo/Idh/MocA family oxidoreductase [Pelotomaculum]MCG9967099.1 Gfo/Idh/MocA family oxidoreductase [Pelotomaculum terephthalicicum JT]OPX87803.1 MAG: putative oxidoreductase YcjS [Pelotomaculum sp. PtaB.Bin117]OPY63855.1 MAG: putative oxidoreductase YcjS [Pelotomaculum sp. PtaU1.Bin065]